MVLAGSLIKAPDCKINPAGIPLTRLLLEHHSRQEEAGLPREVRFKISVLASGQTLGDTCRRLQKGQLVRVEGYLQRVGFQGGQYRIVIQAEQVSVLKD